MDNQPGSYREIEHTADLGIEVTAPDLPTLFASAGEALYSLIADPATVQSEEGEISHLTEEQVVGKISGEKLDLQRHTFHTEIKGVTYHDFKMWQDKGEWHVRVIFDV